MDKTQNLQLKVLKYNQAHKEVLINEAITVFDAMISRVVVDILEDVPEEASEGELYIISKEDENKLALSLNGWRYFTPKEGWEFWVQSKEKKFMFHKKKWNVV